MRVPTGFTMAGTVATVITTADTIIPIIIRTVVMVPMVTGQDHFTDSHLSMGITTGHRPPSGNRVGDGSSWQTVRSSEQRRDFSRLLRKSPKSGLPRVGLSLSAAISGDYDKAAHEMRLAFVQDPEGAGDLPSKRRLRERLGVLVDYYQGIVIRDGDDTDSAFMLAALSYLLNDSQSAVTAISAAIDHGDDSTSARNLKKLLV